jgi:DNA-binding transcriptional LysR family regulator
VVSALPLEGENQEDLDAEAARYAHSYGVGRYVQACHSRHRKPQFRCRSRFVQFASSISVIDDVYISGYGWSVFVAQLEAFAEIARRGNVSRAAEALFLSQPALSARLKSLEAELGAELFVRTRRGVRLTDTGRAFLPYAQRAIDSIADGKLFVAELARGGEGRLAIGAAPSVSTSVLPVMLSRFRADRPNVQLVVVTGHSEEVLEMVLREQVDLGLVRELRHPEIVATPLYDDELVLVVEPGHPFANRGRIKVADVTSEHLILFDRTSSYHELTSVLFREAGIVPRGVMELDTIDGAKKMVEQGLGVALLPHSSVAGELAAGRLATAKLADARAIRRRIVAVRRRDSGSPNELVSAFLALPVDPLGAVATNRPTPKERRSPRQRQ